DAGYWFSLDSGQTFPFRGTRITIPTLTEVLRHFPSLLFTVEIKQTDPPIEEQVIAVVRDCGRAADVLLASEHDQVLARARPLAPKIRATRRETDVGDE